MKTSTLLTTTTTLLATTHASTVLLSTTPCLDPSYPLTQFSIDLNTANPVPVSLPTVCGLRIVSATDGIDVHTIQCQAFRDAEGTKPGSAVFTYDSPALIATNPVQEGAVKCSVVETYPTAAAVQRRQDNSTASTSVPLSWSSSFNVVRSTLFNTQTVSASESSATPSTLVQTMVVTANSSAVSSSSSSSAERTPSAPSATTQPPATQTGAAGKLGLSVGIIGAAVAALML